MGVNVTGVSVEQILNYDWDILNALDKKDLTKLTSRLVSAANKRLRRIEELNIDSINPAYNSAMRSGGFFSVKDKKDVNAIRNEFARISNFMRLETSTKKGAKQYYEKVVKGFNLEGKTNEEIKRFFSTLNKIKEIDPQFTKKSERYYEFGAEISDMLTEGIDSDEIAIYMDERLTELYEKEQELNESVNFTELQKGK